MSQNLTIKYENENAERCPPLQSTVESQINGDSWRFLVALVDLSEPLSYDDQVARIEAKPGNSRYFQGIQMRADLSHLFPSISTSNRHKSSRTRQVPRPCTELKP